MSSTKLPPCRCGDPDRFHDGPCCAGRHPEQWAMADDEKNPTTLERVVRSPRFYGIVRYIDGWIVSIVVDPSVGTVSNIDGPTIDDAITAAALRISALDSAEWRKRPPLSDAEALAIYEEIFGVRREDYDDDEQREIADEMRAILAADTDDAAYEVIAWWHDVDLVNRSLVAEMRAKYRGAK